MSINVEKRTIIIQLTENILGTVPKDKEIFSSFVQGQQKKKAELSGAILTESMLDEEVDSLPDVDENLDVKGWTGFMEDDEGLFIMNYMIKGFLKSAWETCQEVGHISKLPAYKKWIDRLIFVEPRKIRFYKDPECIHVVKEPHGALERPLRTVGPKGERVALAKSDFVKEGIFLKFDVVVLQRDNSDKKISSPKIDIKDIEQCFEYGKYIGLGQWRGSGGYGTFEIVSINEN